MSVKKVGKKILSIVLILTQIIPAVVSAFRASKSPPSS